MSITRQQIERRKELAHFRNAKCLKHNTKGCDNWQCRSDIRERYRARQKKSQKLTPANNVSLDALFNLLRNPTAIDPAPTPIDPQKRTLRQRIELTKIAA